jgi:hypothetical protein
MSTRPLPITAYRQPIPAQLFLIDDGDAGTAQTVAAMYQQIYEGSKNGEINAQAIDIIHGARVRDFDFGGQRRAIFNWFPRNIIFVRDPVAVETVRTPVETLHRRAGDCDCQTVLMGALLSTIGNHVRITTVRSQPGNPDFSHVFLEVLDGDKWVPVDSARPGARYARGPEYYKERFPWPNPFDPDAALGRLRGLNGYEIPQNAAALNNTYRPMVVRRLAGLRGLNRLAGARLGRLRGLRGLGRGRMGDDSGDGGFDFSGVAQIISAGGAAAANTIRAVNTPSFSSGLVYNPATGSYTSALSPYGSPYGSVAPSGYVNIFGTLVPTNTLLAGAAAFALLMIWEKR